MTYKFWIVYLFYFFPACLLAQNYYTDIIPWVPNPIYQNSKAQQVFALSDGGYVLSYFSEDIHSLVVSLYDECGSIIWTKRYGREGYLYYVRDIIQDQKGRIVLLGYERFMGEPLDGFLIQLNPQGNVNWDQKFGYSMADVPYFIYETNNSDYIVMVNQDQYPGLRLIRFDENGQIVWAKGYNDNHIWGYGLLTNDGHILCRTSHKHFMVDGDGHLVWGQYLSNSSGSSFPTEVNDGYVMYVSNGDAGIIYKLATNGDVMWQKWLPKINSQHIISLKDSLYVTGILSGAFSGKLGVIATDLEGNFGYTKAFDLMASGWGSPVDVALLSDNNVLFSSISSGNNPSVAILKTDENMTQACGVELDFETPDSGLVIEKFNQDFVEVDVSINATFHNLESSDNVMNTDRICSQNQDIMSPFPLDTSLCYGTKLVLNLPDNYSNILWSTGSTEQSVTITSGGPVSVDFSVCDTTYNFNIDVLFEDCNCTPNLPNIFSPNNDNLNDRLQVISDCPLFEYEMKVFNRWGQPLFVARNMDDAWDGYYKGKPVPNDAYIVLVRYKIYENGILVPKILSQDVTVVR